MQGLLGEGGGHSIVAAVHCGQIGQVRRGESAVWRLRGKRERVGGTRDPSRRKLQHFIVLPQPPSCAAMSPRKVTTIFSYSSTSFTLFYIFFIFFGGLRTLCGGRRHALPCTYVARATSGSLALSRHALGTADKPGHRAHVLHLTLNTQFVLYLYHTAVVDTAKTRDFASARLTSRYSTHA